MLLGCFSTLAVMVVILVFLVDRLGNALDVRAEEVKHLTQEVNRLRSAIKKHRSQRADDLCWMDDDVLYEALGDGVKRDNQIGDPEAMLKNCRRFIEKRCRAGGPWKSYVELEEENAALKLRIDVLEGRFVTDAELGTGD